MSIHVTIAEKEDKRRDSQNKLTLEMLKVFHCTDENDHKKSIKKIVVWKLSSKGLFLNDVLNFHCCQYHFSGRLLWTTHKLLYQTSNFHENIFS